MIAPPLSESIFAKTASASASGTSTPHVRRAGRDDLNSSALILLSSDLSTTWRERGEERRFRGRGNGSALELRAAQ
jgi:hypothetical protein